MHPRAHPQTRPQARFASAGARARRASAVTETVVAAASDEPIPSALPIAVASARAGPGLRKSTIK
jgi:hypothetical protein